MGPAPKKSSPLLPILLGGGGAFLFLFLLITVGVALASGNDDDTGSSPTYTPSYSPSYSSPTYSPTTDLTSPTNVFSSPSLPTNSETTTGTDGGGYGSPENNKIYRTGKMKGVGCRARLRSVSNYRKFAKPGTACLDKAWRAQLKKRGIEHRSPSVVVAHGTSKSPCGGSGNIGYVPAAFYCPANETMYFSIRSAQKQTRDHMFVTLPHEYGHHVQRLTGINTSYNARYQRNYSTVSKRTRMSRRLELQAQCLAGMFVGRNYRTMGEGSNIRNAENRVGDDHLGNSPNHRTHGRYASNRYWYWRGFDTANAGTCNSWIAPGRQVR